MLTDKVQHESYYKGNNHKTQFTVLFKEMTEAFQHKAPLVTLLLLYLGRGKFTNHKKSLREEGFKRGANN